MWDCRRARLIRTQNGYVLAMRRDYGNEICEHLTERELCQLQEAIERELRTRRVGPSEVK